MTDAITSDCIHCGTPLVLISTGEWRAEAGQSFHCMEAPVDQRGTFPHLGRIIPDLTDRRAVERWLA